VTSGQRIKIQTGLEFASPTSHRQDNILGMSSFQNLKRLFYSVSFIADMFKDRSFLFSEIFVFFNEKNVIIVDICFRLQLTDLGIFGYYKSLSN
jgi:hypothetical protein